MSKKKHKKNEYTDYDDYDKSKEKENDNIEETINISMMTMNQIINSM